MCVPADEHVGVDRAEEIRQHVVRRDPCVDRIVGGRRRMAHEYASESLDLELAGKRPSRDGDEARFAELIGAPRRVAAELFITLQNSSVGIPTDDRGVSSGDEVEHLDRPRPGDGVSDDDDRVDAFALDVREHRFERRQVAVDVADRGDAHGARLTSEREAGPGADEVERRAVRAGELARRRPEVARTNACDRSGKLRLQLGDVSAGERRRHDVARPLEELVRDLDLGRPGPQADERVDEPLQPVLGLDDLGRLAPFERVRLVVDDQRPLALLPEDVEPATDEDAVVLERERPLRARAAKSWRAAQPTATRSTRRRARQSARARPR